MSTTTPTVALRPVTDDDRELLVAVYWSTRVDELSQVAWPAGQQEAFVRWQFGLQDAEYRRANPHGSFDVIEVDGRPAGRLYVDRRPGDIRIVDIAMLPESRGRGIGAHLVGRLIEEARSSGCIVSIHVEVHNRAAALYARLGFTVVDQHGMYRRMEWSPPC